MRGDFIAVAIRYNGQMWGAVWTSAGVVRCENLVQQFDRLRKERQERERVARDVRWSDPAYNPSDGLPNSIGG